MEKLRALIQTILFCGLALLSLPSQAQFFGLSEGNSFVDESARQKNIGIEVEFVGLSDETVVKLITKSYPEAKFTGQIQTGLMAETSIGQIKIVVDGQAYEYEKDPEKFAQQLAIDMATGPREIVFPPVRFEDITKMHELIRSVQAAGAKGTSKKVAVSLQVNLEMPLLTDKKSVNTLLNLVRNYFNPENRAQILSLMKVPKVRSKFLFDYSPGFTAKLLEANYSPSPRELYDDFMYRQSLERLGSPDAWTADITTVRDRLLAYAGDAAVVPAVVKMNKLRISSLLMLAFPEDPLTKRVVASAWARPMPIVEFREFNNDFDLLPKVRLALGIERGAELFGAYAHDRLFSDLTGVSKGDIGRLRTGLLEGRKTIRYVLRDPDLSPLTTEDRAWLAKYSKNVIQIQLSPDKVGTIPLVLKDGSVVWHRRNIHRTTLLGEFNPGLENALMQQALENKLVEAMTFNKYAPGSFPETVAFKSVRGANTNRISAMLKALNARFPTGWVMKGAWDLCSERIVITDKTDFAKAIADYKNGFEVFKEKTLAELAGNDPEVIVTKLKTHTGYTGSKILSLLSDKNLLLVQQRRILVEEFRVEILNGHVLGQGSTIPRYGYLDETPAKADPALIARVESYAQTLMNRLPTELRALPYAFDVALTKEGDFVVIETNPGGNSSFLEENPASSKALVRHLKKYRPATEGLLTERAQMDWVQTQLTEFGLKSHHMYPGIELGLESFDDSAFAHAKPEPILIAQGKKVVSDRLAPRKQLTCGVLFGL